MDGRLFVEVTLGNGEDVDPLGIDIAGIDLPEKRPHPGQLFKQRLPFPGGGAAHQRVGRLVAGQHCGDLFRLDAGERTHEAVVDDPARLCDLKHRRRLLVGR